jgi:8-oxo-dGTP pyrophosphatase MutT (NUDIX family)
MTIDKTAIRNAATVIVLRNRFKNPSILMGKRGAHAAFMPNKFVFPGGTVDNADFDISLSVAIPSPCWERLAKDCTRNLIAALCVAAIREL